METTNASIHRRERDLAATYVTSPPTEEEKPTTLPEKGTDNLSAVFHNEEKRTSTRKSAIYSIKYDIDKVMDQKAEKTERAMPPPVSTRVVPPPLFSPFSAFLIAVVIPLTLGAWVLAARACDSGVVFASQAALVTCMPTLLTAIVFPLWHSGSLAFISNWFVMSVFFNAAWQCPQLLLKDYFATAAASIASQPTADGNAYFPLMLFWWGYSTSDLDYASLSNFFVLAELSYWPISATAVVALYKLHRGRGRDRDLALILLLVCGSLQAYNVFFFISYGGTCLAHTFSNVAHGTLPTVVYFFMNLLWGVSGGTAAVVAGRELLGRRRRGDEEYEEEYLPLNGGPY